MTISSTTRKAGPFNGNGATTSFPFTFKVFEDTDFRVVYTTSAGVELDLVLDADYSVTLNGDQDASPGGTVTYPIIGTALPSGAKLTILGDIDALQETDLTNGGGFYPQVIENMVDRLTMLVQQLTESQNRSLTYQTSDSGYTPKMPAIADLADSLLGFDSSGNPVAAATAADLQALIDAAEAVLANSNAGAISASTTNLSGTNVQDQLTDIATVKFVSGTWTPGYSSAVNLNTWSSSPFTYSRCASVVTFSGVITLRGTGTGLVSFEMTLPIATTMTQHYHANGVIVGDGVGTGVNMCGTIEGAGTKVKVSFFATSVAGADSFRFTGQYRII